MKYDVFISYSRKDYAEEIINEKGEKEERIIPGNIVSQTIKCLESNEISYWWDKDGIYSADQFIAVIAKAIRESSIFLFISTENSNESYWTPKEISAACHLKKKIIPFKVDDSYYTDSVLLLLSDVDFIDYSKDKKKAFEKLEVSIKKILEDERLRLEEERKRKEEEEHRRREEEERHRREEEEKKKEKEINKPIKKDAIYYAKTRH
ncbi:MAG: toll/interleukin-1 receptor domain-containing protein, partial [Flavobacteriales bacterium]|nr:toll/interleukin-1 receptor domain-containing protein [Flavobacteriales bacterium]